MASPSPQLVYRFGPFEFDNRAPELRKGETRLRVPERSLRILSMLIERRGELVPREEIQQSLWPNNTIVEFDHGINTAVRQLRSALGDSAETPKYIETVPRRGYRFLAEVTVVPAMPARVPSAPEADGIQAGVRFGPYELIAAIGHGGMGEVWKAHDSRLGRDVAVKISHERFSDRFEREARAIAALNHPNVCTLFDVGPDYLVMELIEGPTLADRIKEGPIPLEEALGIARQIADALEAAHTKGIVHRDLKPANIKMRMDGSIKVLDFGLAKDIALAGLTPDSPTALSVSGTIMGTAGYMSPEQARGGATDKRTDIWAFGVVLYEMVTGKKLFERSTLSDTLAAVIMQEPDLNLAPTRIRRLLAKCLQKDANQRLRDLSSMEFLIEETTPVAKRGNRVVLMTAAAATVAIASAVFAFINFPPKPPETSVARFSILPPAKSSFNLSDGISISPDGRRVVFPVVSPGANPILWIRSLDSLTLQPLVAVSGSGDAGEAHLPATMGGTSPFWSPDSKSIAFFSGFGEKLVRIDLDGSPPINIADIKGGAGGTWNSRGVIVFSGQENHPLLKVSASGGTPVPVTILEKGKEIAHRWPWFLPDGNHFLFAAYASDGNRATIRIGALDSPKVSTLMEADSNAIYVQNPHTNNANQGFLLFQRENTLMAQQFDAKRLSLIGSAVAISQVAPARHGAGAFSASSRGSLVYGNGSGVLTQLLWRDRSGRPVGELGDPVTGGPAALSPDGTKAAQAIADPLTGKNDVWIHDVARDVPSRFTFQGDEQDPIWSPDGKFIVFSKVSNGATEIVRKPADGAGNEIVLFTDKNGPAWIPSSWSPDGTSLLLWRLDRTTGTIVVLRDPLGAETAGKPGIFMTGPFDWDGRFSPDGKWVTYSSADSGKLEVYIAPFPGPGEKVRVSSDGGAMARWRKDGKEIIYMADDGRIMAAEVRTGNGTVGIDGTRPLFGPVKGISGLEVSADGQRVLINLLQEQSVSGSVTLVQNWMAGLQK